MRLCGTPPQHLEFSQEEAAGSKWGGRGGWGHFLEGCGLSIDPGSLPLSLAQSLWALFTSTLAISLVFAVIPLCHDVKVLALVMALAGLAMGCIDTVANMQLVRMYQKDSAIFLQVSHPCLSYGPYPQQDGEPAAGPPRQPPDTSKIGFPGFWGGAGPMPALP